MVISNTQNIYYDTRPNHQNNEPSVRRSTPGCGMVLEYLSIPTKETDGFTEQELIDYVLENLITQ